MVHLRVTSWRNWMSEWFLSGVPASESNCYKEFVVITAGVSCVYEEEEDTQVGELTI